jgi:hypothetical protein
MPNSIADLYGNVQRDEWRDQVGFTAEIQICSEALLQPNLPDEQRSEILSAWLQKHQPCLFGRIAAKLQLIHFCFLGHDDLLRNDDHIRHKIQEERTNWTRAAFEGRKSAFVILCASERLFYAKPDSNLLNFVLRLCSLYLLSTIEANRIYIDQVQLEMPGPNRTTWRWNVGVNYFSSSGDRRWWADHRIPGGVAFSMNSVGHLVKSGLIANKMLELANLLDAPEENLTSTKIDSLEKALEMAMRTIDLAAMTLSGKATELLSLPDNKADLPVRECPVHLPTFLAAKNYCTYGGYYHTDQTVPSEYFLDVVERPSQQPYHLLDFTYLFDRNIENPDFKTTGQGVRIRALDDPPLKRLRSFGVEV